MSLIVRYPDGTAVTYNNASYLNHGTGGWHLYTKEGGDWVASIQASAGAVVECQVACKVERPEDQTSLERLLEATLGRLREHKNRNSSIHWPLLESVRQLKVLLSQCDMRGGQWR